MKRRKFLLSILGLGVAAAGLQLKVKSSKSTKPAYLFFVDVTKCIGCGRCVIACKIENDVPLEPIYFRTWIERYTWLKDGELKVDSPNGGFGGFETEITEILEKDEIEKSYFVPKLCNQCEEPPCVQVCPVGATFKTEDGVVLVDEKYCIGCRYCIQACPYGARYIYPSSGPVKSRVGTADKCTWCYHRIRKGLEPACVKVCPTGARQFIFLDSEDQDSAYKTKLQKIKQLKGLRTLKPEMGTKPKVLYYGIDSDVR
ncbi:MAG: 4Fe-4S dicluster domain-containing protein [Archaeoglobus sp.]|nr:4Fe-4S dicluster domain-containing protein [Archaeoglobus sp.]